MKNVKKAAPRAAKAPKRKIAGTVADPTLPKTPVTVGGKRYDLCLDLGALAEAETAINMELFRAGSAERVNLLAALPYPNLMNTRVVFAAAVRTFHPEIGFEEAMKMLRIEDLFDVSAVIARMWESTTQEVRGDGDPPRPGTEAGSHSGATGSSSAE